MCSASGIRKCWTAFIARHQRRTGLRAARGEDSPSSDVDLLVVTLPKMGLRFARVYRELNELLGVPVDLVDQAGLRSQHRELIKDTRPL